MPDKDFEETLDTLEDFFPELNKPTGSPPPPPPEPEEEETLVLGDGLAPAPVAKVEEPSAPPAEFGPVAAPPPVVRAEPNDSEEMGDLLVAPPPPIARIVSAPDDDDDGSPQDFQFEREVPDITHPWMKGHQFSRVSSVQKVREIVDSALARGRCSLDTETEGLDTRIVYDGLGRPRTVHQIVGFCISVDGHEGFYIPVRHKPDDGDKQDFNLPVAEVEAEIRRLCQAAQPIPPPGAREKDGLSYRVDARPKVVIYFWNAKFDQEMLYPIVGIDWWHPESFEDGMLACFCDYSADKALSLKHKAPMCLRDQQDNAYTMIELKELFIRGRPIRFQTLSPDEPGVLKYACSDAICTYLLCEPPRKWEKDRPDYMKKAHELYTFTYRLEKQCVQAVRVMERYRTRLDRKQAEELRKLHDAEFERIKIEIQNFALTKGYHLDPSSSKQLSDFLFTDKPNCLNISPKPDINEASQQYKTDGETLEAMVKENPHAPPILKWIVDYRGEEKMLSTYLEHLVKNPDRNDELRFGFKETGAGTGRFSAPAGEPEHGYSGIPIHGIPNESVMRKLFLAREGYTFVKCDYAGQELRIAANVSGEPVWIKEFLEGDGDLHTITARAFFNKDVVSKDERKMGKIANFALIYGGGPQAIIRATHCDKVEASRRKQAFDKAVPVFAQWIKSQQKAVKKDLGVWTPFKRWLAIPDANNVDRKVQAACERYAVNYPIQGSGADIMKISIVMLHKEFHKRGWLRGDASVGYVGDDSVRMLLTVHDEIVFEIKHDRVVDAVPVIVEIMERPAKMATTKWKVPLVTEPLVGPNWGTGYKCERYVEGKTKVHDGEFLVNGFVYGTVREVDLGKESPGEGELEHSRNEEKKKLKIAIVNPAWLRNVGKAGARTDDVAGPAQAAPPPSSNDVTVELAHPQEPAPVPAPPVQAVPIAVTPAAPAPAPALSPPPATTTVIRKRIVRLRIHKLTEETILQVLKALLEAEDLDHGMILRLTDHCDRTLIDPKVDIRVDAKRLSDLLSKTYNISDGAFTEES